MLSKKNKMMNELCSIDAVAVHLSLRRVVAKLKFFYPSHDILASFGIMRLQHAYMTGDILTEHFVMFLRQGQQGYVGSSCDWVSEDGAFALVLLVCIGQVNNVTDRHFADGF